MINSELEGFASASSLLDAAVRARPGHCFIKTRNRSLTYSEFWDEQDLVARKLMAVGVGQGDIVACLLPNSVSAVVIWFAVMRLGAIWAPVNTGFGKLQMRAAFERLNPKVSIVDGTLTNLDLDDLERCCTRLIFVDGRPSENMAFLESIVPSPTLVSVSVAKEERAAIQFTSGSTGVSKPVELSHGYLVGQARLIVSAYGFVADDVLYCPFPLHHWDAAVGTVLSALTNCSTAALSESFSVKQFWSDIRLFDATVFDFMGAILTFLYAQPPNVSDRDHRVRLAWGVPMPAFKVDFERRFGIRLLEGYGSTEAGVFVFQSPDQTYPEGSCGRTCDEFELRIVDDDGADCAVGVSGEIVSRPRFDATLMMSGYLGMPDVNAELIREGWYHTGDLGRLDESGNLFFVGRKKDVIRRRGENISALEIETVLLGLPEILEAAAFGLPSPHTEEDVAVAIVLREGQRLTAEDIRRACAGGLASYMCPEHVFFLPQLPKTPTQKIAKSALRAACAPVVESLEAGA